MNTDKTLKPAEAPKEPEEEKKDAELSEEELDSVSGGGRKTYVRPTPPELPKEP